MTGERAVVIGVGNEFRRDDGIGRVVLSRLGDHDLPGVRLLPSDGEPTALLDAWDGVPLAIVIDAVVCEPSRPGTVHRTALDGQFDTRAVGTHGLGIPEAVRLGDVLGRAPRRLVVLAVEAADVSLGPGLSDEVAAAVPSVVDAVLTEIEGDAPA